MDESERRSRRRGTPCAPRFPLRQLSHLGTVYPWDEVAPDATFVDVGGSTGEVCLALVKAKPHMKAIVQDLPKAIEQAQTVKLHCIGGDVCI